MLAKVKKSVKPASTLKTVEPTPPVFMALAGNCERRLHRRHDVEDQDLVVERWDAMRQTGTTLGTIVDISASGVRFKTKIKDIRPDSHIRLRLNLPPFAGISPFVDLAHEMQPKTDWVGWLVVTRIEERDDGMVNIAGRLVDMDEIDRGMFGLYLSLQPLAA